MEAFDYCCVYIFFFSYPSADRMVTVGRWAAGMSADYEEVLDAPKPQKPKTKAPRVVHF